MSRLLSCSAFCLAFVSNAPCQAQEPITESVLQRTSPRPVTTQMLPYYIPNSLPIPGTREVWQYYGVDSTGRFRPLVVNSPLGAYYLYNGQPFPWTTTRPGLYMPYAVD